MSDVELGHRGLVLLAMLLLALLGVQCAHAQRLNHSEAWKSCLAACEKMGGIEPVLVEKEFGRACVCTKMPEPI